MELPEDGRLRAYIEQIRPAAGCGRAARKCALGDDRFGAQFEPDALGRRRHAVHPLGNMNGRRRNDGLAATEHFDYYA